MSMFAEYGANLLDMAKKHLGGTGRFGHQDFSCPNRGGPGSGLKRMATEARPGRER